MADKADILICGGGIIGLTLARELSNQGYKNIAVLEKEEETGRHASGRNSGVLHAGIYYTEDSLKARLCLKGNHLIKNYCRQNNIPVLETGKVIVARNAGETTVLEQLYQRALKNGAKVELINEERLRSVEPFAKTFRFALYSPETAVVNPRNILDSLEQELLHSGTVRLLKGRAITGVSSDREVNTTGGKMRFDLFVNAAGAYSDRIAHMFGTGRNYRILPFRGSYRKLTEKKSHLVKGNIYPVPDMANPFLGIHFTKAADGTVYIGPTAILAFGRENYEFLKGADREFLQILLREGVMFFTNAGFRKVAVSETGKYFLRSFFGQIKDMIDDLNIEDILPSDKAGIRPQLVDRHKNELVMDFVILQHNNTIHILNAVSPAFTSSMAFAEFLVNRYIS